MEVELDLWSSRSPDDDPSVDHILSDIDCCDVTDVDEFILGCSSVGIDSLVSGKAAEDLNSPDFVSVVNSSPSSTSPLSHHHDIDLSTSQSHHHHQQHQHQHHQHQQHHNQHNQNTLQHFTTSQHHQSFGSHLANNGIGDVSTSNNHHSLQSTIAYDPIKQTSTRIAPTTTTNSHQHQQHQHHQQHHHQPTATQFQQASPGEITLASGNFHQQHHQQLSNILIASEPTTTQSSVCLGSHNNSNPNSQRLISTVDHCYITNDNQNANNSALPATKPIGGSIHAFFSAQNGSQIPMSISGELGNVQNGNLVVSSSSASQLGATDPSGRVNLFQLVLNNQNQSQNQTQTQTQTQCQGQLISNQVALEIAQSTAPKGAQQKRRQSDGGAAATGTNKRLAGSQPNDPSSQQQVAKKSGSKSRQRASQAKLSAGSITSSTSGSAAGVSTSQEDSLAAAFGSNNSQLDSNQATKSAANRGHQSNSGAEQDSSMGAGSKRRTNATSKREPASRSKRPKQHQDSGQTSPASSSSSSGVSSLTSSSGSDVEMTPETLATNAERFDACSTSANSQRSSGKPNGLAKSCGAGKISTSTPADAQSNGSAKESEQNGEDQLHKDAQKAIEFAGHTNNKHKPTNVNTNKRCQQQFSLTNLLATNGEPQSNSAKQKQAFGANLSASSRQKLNSLSSYLIVASQQQTNLDNSSSSSSSNNNNNNNIIAKTTPATSDEIDVKNGDRQSALVSSSTFGQSTPTTTNHNLNGSKPASSTGCGQQTAGLAISSTSAGPRPSSRAQVSRTSSSVSSPTSYSSPSSSSLVSSAWSSSSSSTCSLSGSASSSPVMQLGSCPSTLQTGPIGSSSMSSLSSTTSGSNQTLALISNQDWKSAQSGQIVLLTDEERRTLIAEGYPIPQRFPLTKAEERSLKKVRRKIKNKISAQESRRKKKEYMEELEKKVALMEQRIEQLERENKLLTSIQDPNSTGVKLMHHTSLEPQHPKQLDETHLSSSSQPDDEQQQEHVVHPFVNIDQANDTSGQSNNNLDNTLASLSMSQPAISQTATSAMDISSAANDADQTASSLVMTGAEHQHLTETTTTSTATATILVATTHATTSDEESFIDEILRHEQQQLANGDVQDTLMANLVVE